MCCDDLPNERKKRRQRVFGRESAVFDALAQEFVKSRHVRSVGVVSSLRIG